MAWNINAGQTTSISLSYDGLTWNNASRSPAVLNLIYCGASNGTHTAILGGANFGANTQDNGYSTAMVLTPTSTNTNLSPTNASLQFTANDTGANDPPSGGTTTATFTQDQVNAIATREADKAKRAAAAALKNTNPERTQA